MLVSTDSFRWGCLTGEFWGGLPKQIQIALVRSDFVQTRDLLWEDLVEANFTGYARPDGNFKPTILGPDGNRVFVLSSAAFRCTGDGPENLIWGWALLHDLGFQADLLATCRFPAPVPITKAGQGIAFAVQVPYGV